LSFSLRLSVRHTEERRWRGQAAPLIQAEATSLPVITLLSVISRALLFGPFAAFLATPLTLFVIAGLDVLYTEPKEKQENGAIGGSSA
jgi:predicted PurR-regulated permease PerM